MTDRKIEKYLTSDHMIRASAAVTTEVSREICSRQNAMPLAALALSRVATGALLLASQLKSGQHLGIHFDGKGPLEGLFAEASFEGKVRAYCGNPGAILDFSTTTHPVREAIGEGFLHVVHSLPHQKEAHRGTVALGTGDVSENLVFYLHQSKQIPSIMNLATNLDQNGIIEVSGGVLIELMPGATEDVIDRLERNAKEIDSISTMMKDGALARELAEAYLKGFELLQIEHDYPMQYQCNCSSDRVKRSLNLIGPSAVAELMAKGTPLEVTCEFCGEKYSVSLSELQTIYDETCDTSLN